MKSEPRLRKPKVLFIGGGGSGASPSPTEPLPSSFPNASIRMSFLVNLTPSGLDLGFSINPLTEVKRSNYALGYSCPKCNPKPHQINGVMNY